MAEGAGSNLMDALASTDPSGNKRLPPIGMHLKAEVCLLPLALPDCFANVYVSAPLSWLPIHPMPTWCFTTG